MTTLVLLEGKVRPGGLKQVEEFFEKHLPATRGYDGCQSLVCYLNEEDCTVVTVQLWDSQSHYEDYLAWREKTGVFPEFKQLCNGEVVIRFFEQMDV